MSSSSDEDEEEKDAIARVRKRYYMHTEFRRHKHVLRRIWIDRSIDRKKMMNPTLTLGLLELCKREQEHAAGTRTVEALGRIDEDSGIFELRSPFPANLRCVEELDLSEPRHACNRHIPVRRSGDLLLEVVARINRLGEQDDGGSSVEEDSHPYIELFQYDFLERKIVIDVVPCEMGRVVSLSPFPNAGVNLLQIGKPIYLKIGTRLGRERRCNGHLFLIYGLLDRELRVKLASWEGEEGQGAGCVHRDRSRGVFRAVGMSDFGHSPNSIAAFPS